jgi:ribonuclease-3
LYPQKNEGELTKLRSAIVNRKSLNQLAKKIGLIQHIKTQVNLDTPGLSLPGNVLEALIGAIYVDKGYHAANGFIISKLLKAHINLDSLEEEYENYKSTLLEWSQKEGKSVEIVVNQLPETKNFQAIVIVDGSEIGSGSGRSKKIAEKEAAWAALKNLGVKS